MQAGFSEKDHKLSFDSHSNVHGIWVEHCTVHCHKLRTGSVCWSGPSSSMGYAQQFQDITDNSRVGLTLAATGVLNYFLVSNIMEGDTTRKNK
jgi:hypothetical protein